MKKKTLVLGASSNPARYSNMAIKRLLLYGHPVEGVGLKEEIVEGVPVRKGTPHYEDVDTVTLYLNPQRQEAYYDYILSLKPKRVIFNPGTENPELYKLLFQNNIESEVACTLVLLGVGQY